MSWWDQPSTSDFVAGIVVGVCLMLFSAFWVLCAARRERERVRVMSRLSEKLAAAAAVAPRQAAKIEARADSIIAFEPELEKMTDEAFAPHEALLAEAHKGVQDLKHDLATMSNMPPLVASPNSSAEGGNVTPLKPGSTGAVEPGPAIGADAH